MADPPILRPNPSSEPTGASVLERDERRRGQAKAAYQTALRRRMVWSGVQIAAAAGDTVTAEMHVLQKDFAQVVGSPTGGYVQAEIVIDATTQEIRIYVPP